MNNIALIFTGFAIGLASLTGLGAPRAFAASTCDNLTWQLEANSSNMQRENGNMASNTAMMNASAAAGDATMTRLYASMGKDTAIRMIGLIVEGRALFVAADNEPGNCGSTEAEIKSYIKSTYDAEKAMNKSISTYKKIFN